MNTLPTEAGPFDFNLTPIQALEKCRDKFRDYARAHMDKGTIEGAQKARSNLDMAEMCEETLARHGEWIAVQSPETFKQFTAEELCDGEDVEFFNQFSRVASCADKIVTAAIDLRNSGYDGPFMGEEVAPLFSALAAYERATMAPELRAKVERERGMDKAMNFPEQIAVEMGFVKAFSRDISDRLWDQGVNLDDWDYAILASPDILRGEDFEGSDGKSRTVWTPKDYTIERLLSGCCDNTWYKAMIEGKEYAIGIAYHG